MYKNMLNNISNLFMKIQMAQTVGPFFSLLYDVLELSKFFNNLFTSFGDRKRFVLVPEYDIFEQFYILYRQNLLINSASMGL